MNNWVLLSVGLLFLIPALMLWGAARQKLEEEEALKHYERAMPISSAKVKNETEHERELSSFSSWLLSLWGDNLSYKQAVAMIVLVILTFVLGKIFLDLGRAVLLTGIVAVLLFVVLPFIKLQRQKAAMVAQMPAFIDQLIRALSVGKSMEGAMRSVTAEVETPLRNVLDKVLRSTDLGVSFNKAVRRAAESSGVKEMSLLALAVNISSTYGSSPQGLLRSIIHMIRRQEQARRELAIMTGETKVTAWVLGLMPSAIVGYILIVNPGYFQVMLDDPAGLIVLKVAIGMQLLGGFIFWRMLKSV